MRTFKEYLDEKAAGFNITRVSMPQIKDQAKFKSYLNALGIGFWINRMNVDLINPIQLDIDQDKVQSIDPLVPADPIIVSDSSYILDGHHRYYAHVFNDMDDIEVLQVDKGINQLLALANDFVDIQNSNVGTFADIYGDPLAGFDGGGSDD